MTIQGKYNTAEVFTDVIEESAISQVVTLLNQPFSKDSKVRMMPDVHAGAGCTIGTTMTIIDKLCPNLVGVDIGCFTKDTKVALADGRDLSFEELIKDKQEHYGYSLDKSGHVQVSKLEYPRKIKTTEKLLDITLDNNQHIKCTRDHIFYKRDMTETMAGNLKIGDSLYPLYIKPAKEINDKCNDEHLCIFDGVTSDYILIHKLADDYNERHGLGVHYVGRGYVRHHKDFNKYNNNPTNIERLLYEDHFKVHYKNVSKTNKAGISGFKAASVKDPLFYSKAGKRRAYVTWHGENSEVNRSKVSERMKNRNVSEKARELSRQRQLTNNTTKFSSQNKEEWFKNRQKIGKIKKVLQYLKDNNLELNEINYNNALCHFYNYQTFNKSLSFLKTYGLSFEKVLAGETVTNHKVVDIKEIPGEDVYCLTCQEFGNFALSAGVFVHNCGMLVIQLKCNDIDFAKLDETIRKYIPSGCAVRQSPYSELTAAELHLPEELECADKLGSEVIQRGKNSIGTLGGGNHFIEVDKDDEDNLYLVIHSGSRNLGKQVAEYYQDIAIKSQKSERKEYLDNMIMLCKKDGRQNEIQELIKIYDEKHPSVPDDLAYLTGDNFDAYLHDMEIMQRYAQVNRKYMANIICEKMDLKIDGLFETLHNYIDIQDMILRKGAVSAKKGEKLIIPINMRDGSLICVGKGNSDWNCSAPHGAGRLMSRSQAKKEISLDLFEESMKGIYTTSVNTSTIDESPFAYKNIEDIVNNIGPTVDILKTIKPVYNFKAGE